jgi:hypothetical protein
LEKRKEEQKKTIERFQRERDVQSPWSYAQLPHAIKVFEAGFGEKLSPKSSSPTTRLDSRFRGNDKFLFMSFLRKQESTYFSFPEKRKVGKRKAIERLRRSGLLDTSVSCAYSPHAIKVFERGFGGETFFKKFSPHIHKGKPLFQKRVSLTFLFRT